MEFAETLRALEASLLTDAVRKDAARVAELLADDFCEFGRSGQVYSKAEVLELLRDEVEMQMAMTEFACRVVAEDVALVTYRSHRAVQGAEAISALRSSLWVRRDGRWQIVFHQGTPLDALPVIA
ncbi:MAG: DUF4440 domain-containing protein [Acidobacteriaceae bacterium]